MVHEGVVMPTVQLGVEGISTSVNAITVEDLAEQQITTEVHQRILGILPNFYVSYVPDAAPLTRKQKFKLAVHVSADPVTYFTTGVTAGIEQWQGDFSGYGQEFSGYAKRYAATYGDRLSSTFLGAAALPSLLHQDPRYFYRGHGRVIVRALYAISTVAVCKGDNDKWQPNYSNVGGNLGAAFISSLYYPASDQHSVQVTVDNTLLGVAEGAIGTLFQEFLLHHFTHGAPPARLRRPMAKLLIRSTTRAEHRSLSRVQAADPAGLRSKPWVRWVEGRSAGLAPSKRVSLMKMLSRERWRRPWRSQARATMRAKACA